VTVSENRNAVLRVGTQGFRAGDVRAYVVALHGRRNAGVDLTERDVSGTAVGGDDVSRFWCRAADQRAVARDNTSVAITEGDCAGNVGADVVALQLAAGAAQEDTVVSVAGNDVSRTRCQATNNGVRSAESHDAAAALEALRSGDIGSDQVALNRRCISHDKNAARHAGDHVSCSRRGAAN
jgi:hypothetical protein